MDATLWPSETIEEERLTPSRNTVPDYPTPALFYDPYSHSILSMYRNALSFMRKSFLLTV